MFGIHIIITITAFVTIRTSDCYGGGVESAMNEEGMVCRHHPPLSQTTNDHLSRHCEGPGRGCGPRCKDAPGSWLLGTGTYTYRMTATEFRDWLLAQLANVKPTAREPATTEHAELVAEAKQYCFELGMLDFALSLPQEPVKTPLSAAIQLRRCLRELSAPSESVNSEYLSVKQAAQAFNMSERALYRLCKDGSIISSRYGKAIRIKRADLDGFFAGRQSLTAAMESLFG